ncbi:alpha/beta fold hydrolase [Actinokineospora enzanensis]|uniref:alpha/beta fold hydrolase n=1 Tax=Actinokineospora enzanensis TaxID=155975 RepID=UPI00037579D0|nr:alpha/beta hydrolase [Actinokineospora enzanensis]
MRKYTVPVPRREIAIQDTGGEGHPVLLAHGYALDKTMFTDVAEILAPRYRVIAWDSPGHGETTSTDTEPYSYWDIAREQLHLMDTLSLPQATIGGVSQGGFIALRTALLAPDRVRSLLLMDTQADALDPEDRPRYEQLFGALTEHGPTEELRTSLASQIIGDHPAAVEWSARWQERGIPLGLSVDCLMTRDNLVPRLPEITAPALLLRGSLDMSMPEERMLPLYEGLPHSTQIHTIEGAGHSPTVTHPTATAAVISDFLTQHA